MNLRKYYENGFVKKPTISARIGSRNASNLSLKSIKFIDSMLLTQIILLISELNI